MTISSPTGETTNRLLPTTILDLNYAFAKTAMLVSAVQLHLFTHLADGASTSAALARRTQCHPDNLERLLRGLQTQGLVEHVGDAYQLTPISERFLVAGKPSYLGGDTLAMLDYIPAWLQLTDTLRTETPYRDLGNPLTAEQFFAPRVRDLFPLIYPLATRAVERLSSEIQTLGTLSVLDAAAGSAPWSAAFAKRYPSAQITALDLPQVVEQGQQQVTELGLSAQYTWIAEDMESVTLTPQSYNVVIVGHILRFIGEHRSRALLKKLAQSLQPGGLLLLADAFYSDDRTGPPPAITLDLSMLVNTAHGGIWSCQEVATWLSDGALYHQVERLDVAGPFPVLIARRAEENPCVEL